MYVYKQLADHTAPAALIPLCVRSTITAPSALLNDSVCFYRGLAAKVKLILYSPPSEQHGQVAVGGWLAVNPASVKSTSQIVMGPSSTYTSFHSPLGDLTPNREFKFKTVHGQTVFLNV